MTQSGELLRYVGATQHGQHAAICLDLVRLAVLTWLVTLFALRPPHTWNTEISLFDWPHPLNNPIHESRCESEQHDAV
jgi:hypothetical protein